MGIPFEGFGLVLLVVLVVRLLVVGAAAVVVRQVEVGGSRQECRHLRGGGTLDAENRATACGGCFA